MAATVNVIRRTKTLGNYCVIADITMDNAYPTGGLPINPQTMALTTIDFVLPSHNSGYLFEFDHPNVKLKVFTPTAAAAAHSHTENTAAAYAQNATTAVAGATTAASGTEVSNASNLSTVTVRVIAFGL